MQTISKTFLRFTNSQKDCWRNRRVNYRKNCQSISKELLKSFTKKFPKRKVPIKFPKEISNAVTGDIFKFPRKHKELLISKKNTRNCWRIIKEILVRITEEINKKYLESQIHYRCRAIFRNVSLWHCIKNFQGNSRNNSKKFWNRNTKETPKEIPKRF